MKILAIETSCDDTSIALIEARGKKRVSFNILANVISSQIKIHKKWGGVYPTLAKRAHQENLVSVLKKVLKEGGVLKIKPQKVNKKIEKILEREPELLKRFSRFISKTKKPNIQAIAVTTGPGLEPCLWAGINFAKALSLCWNIPIIPVNHIEAHIYANFINQGKINLSLDIFPAISLIVSGGHTQLILIKKLGNYKILGETRDDAAGECLDKIARILGLEYPGGPIIEKESKKSKSLYKIKLPRPMINTKDYDFSFSGLKTAALYDFKKRNSKTKKDKEYIRQTCKESQQAVIDVLIKKTIKAVRDFEVKTILLGGGVTANKELRRQIKKAVKELTPEIKLLIPIPLYSTDNAVMVGIVSYLHLKEKKDWRKLKANANLRLGK